MDALLSVAQACDYLGVGRSTFYRMLADPSLKIPSMRIGARLRFDPVALKAWAVAR